MTITPMLMLVSMTTAIGLRRGFELYECLLVTTVDPWRQDAGIHQIAYVCGSRFRSSRYDSFFYQSSHSRSDRSGRHAGDRTLCSQDHGSQHHRRRGSGTWLWEVDVMLDGTRAVSMSLRRRCCWRSAVAELPNARSMSVDFLHTYRKHLHRSTATVTIQPSL